MELILLSFSIVAAVLNELSIFWVLFESAMCVRTGQSPNGLIA